MSTASVPNTFASAVTATGLQLDQNYNTIVAYINEPLNRNNWATDSGNTNTIVLTFVPPVSAYSAGLEITFKAGFTNSGGVVINANSLGNKNFIQPGGGALSAGQIEANGIYKAAYNGSAFVYIGQNVLAASQADMETATSAITFVSPANTKYHPGVAKAWAQFNGTATGTITADAAYNVSSIVHGGTGSYTVVFDTPFSSVNYVVMGMAAGFARHTLIDAAVARDTATLALVVASTNSGTPVNDVTIVQFICWGDLP